MHALELLLEQLPEEGVAEAVLLEDEVLGVDGPGGRCEHVPREFHASRPLESTRASAGPPGAWMASKVAASVLPAVMSPPGWAGGGGGIAVSRADWLARAASSESAAAGAAVEAGAGSRGRACPWRRGLLGGLEAVGTETGFGADWGGWAWGAV
jgi:hypothetical protein